MFSKFITTQSSSTPSSARNLDRTIEFVTAVVGEGLRLSYSALTVAARELGEDSSRQLAGQRGAVLAKRLPQPLQPFICRQGGGYAGGVTWGVSVPSDLRDRPVIAEGSATQAVQAWLASQESSEGGDFTLTEE